MISVKDMITRIRAETHDHQKAGYPDYELLMYINDALRFARRTIMDIYPMLLADIDMEGEIGEGENTLFLYKPVSSIIEVRIDGQIIERVNPRTIKKLNEQGKPRCYYLQGTQMLKLWPVADKSYEYSVVAVGDMEQLTEKDETPLPSDFDDFVYEYAMIRMNMTNEFDLSQEQSIMQTVAAQIKTMLHDYMAPGVQLRSYW